MFLWLVQAELVKTTWSTLALMSTVAPSASSASSASAGWRTTLRADTWPPDPSTAVQCATNITPPRTVWATTSRYTTRTSENCAPPRRNGSLIRPGGVGSSCKNKEIVFLRLDVEPGVCIWPSPPGGEELLSVLKKKNFKDKTQKSIKVRKNMEEFRRGGNKISRWPEYIPLCWDTSI